MTGSESKANLDPEARWHLDQEDFVGPSHRQLSRQKHHVWRVAKVFKSKRSWCNLWEHFRLLNSAITYFDTLCWSKMDDPDIYVYIMFVGQFLCHPHYVATLSPEFCSWKPKVTRCGRSMLRSYVYWPNVSKRRLGRTGDGEAAGLLGSFLDIECLLMDHGTQLQPKAGMNKWKWVLDGLVLWCFVWIFMDLK